MSPSFSGPIAEDRSTQAAFQIHRCGETVVGEDSSTYALQTDCLGGVSSIRFSAGREGERRDVRAKGLDGRKSGEHRPQLVPEASTKAEICPFRFYSSFHELSSFTPFQRPKLVAKGHLTGKCSSEL